jgi:hypothetical protein
MADISKYKECKILQMNGLADEETIQAANHCPERPLLAHHDFVRQKVLAEVKKPPNHTTSVTARQRRGYREQLQDRPGLLMSLEAALFPSCTHKPGLPTSRCGFRIT